MSPTLSAIISFSIAIPSIIGVLRITIIHRAFYPFLILLWMGLLNEIISYIVIKSGHSNAINSNAYVLIESLLFVWFFKSQGLFANRRKNEIKIIFLLVGLWGFENLYLSSIRQFSSYFIVVYSFIIVLMSINMINLLISKVKRRFIKNSTFLICIGLILFYTCATLIEVFWIYGLNSSKEFRFQVFEIMTFVNLAVNLIYAIAVLWMPRKREYTLL